MNTEASTGAISAATPGLAIVAGQITTTKTQVAQHFNGVTQQDTNSRIGRSNGSP
jgi:hypothetical protein